MLGMLVAPFDFEPSFGDPLPVEVGVLACSVVPFCCGGVTALTGSLTCTGGNVAGASFNLTGGSWVGGDVIRGSIIVDCNALWAICACSAINLAWAILGLGLGW